MPKTTVTLTLDDAFLARAIQRTKAQLLAKARRTAGLSQSKIANPKSKIAPNAHNANL